MENANTFENTPDNTTQTSSSATDILTSDELYNLFMAVPYIIRREMKSYFLHKVEERYNGLRCLAKVMSPKDINLEDFQFILSSWFEAEDEDYLEYVKYYEHIERNLSKILEYINLSKKDFLNEILYLVKYLINGLEYPDFNVARQYSKLDTLGKDAVTLTIKQECARINSEKESLS